MNRLGIAVAWCAVVTGWAVAGWSLSALLLCLPGLLAATALSAADEGVRRRGRLLALAALVLVLGVAPTSVGVAALVDPSPGAWWFRILALGPLAVACLVHVRPPPSTGAAIRWLLALGVWALLVAAVTPMPAQSAIAALEFLVVVAVVDRLVRSIGLDDAVLALAAALGVLALAALAVGVADVEPPRLPGFEEATNVGLVRLSTLATEPIQLAEAVGPAVVAGVAVALGRRRTSPSLALAGVGVAVTGVVALAATQSRTALLAALVALAWLVLRRRDRTATAVAMLVAAVVITLVGLVGSAAGPLGDLITIRAEGGSGADLRVTEIWPSALDRIAERPVQGWGLAGTETAMQRAMDEGDLQPLVWRNAHHRVLELALSTGIVGLALGLAAVGTAVMRFARRPAPEVEALLVFVVVVGLTGPGSGSAFAGIDELIVVVAAAAAGAVSSAPTPTAARRRPRVPG